MTRTRSPVVHAEKQIADYLLCAQSSRESYAVNSLLHQATDFSLFRQSYFDPLSCLYTAVSVSRNIACTALSPNGIICGMAAIYTS